MMEITLLIHQGHISASPIHGRPGPEGHLKVASDLVDALSVSSGMAEWMAV